ncbi:MAG TPA: caspase family protein [Pyrinomonadaceae bacterium]|nr:caspase family protein [Pyrinomonadaceae bacterium]
MKSLRVHMMAFALFASLPFQTRAQQPRPRIEIDPNASNSVTAVAFSPDGRFLAGANANGTVKLWNLVTGRRNRTLRGHAGSVNAVAFGPDGNAVAGAGDDKTVRVWDAATGREARKLTHDSRVLSVAFGGNNLLAAGCADGHVKVWDVATGQELRALAGHTGGVFGLAFARDGRTLASGSADSLRLWDVTTGGNPRTLRSSTAPFTAAALSPDGKLLAAGLRGAVVRVWDVATSRPLHALTGHAAEITSLAFGADGTLASGDAGGAVKLWRTAASNPAAAPQTGLPSELRSFSAGAATKSLAFGVGGKLLATAAAGPSAKLWQAETGRELASLVAPDEREWIVFTPVGHYDGTAGGMRAVNFVQSGQRVQIDSFFEQLYTPKLLAQVVLSARGPEGAVSPPPGTSNKALLLGTLSAPRRAGVDLTGAVKLPPLVKIALPSAAAAPTLRRSAPVAPAQPQPGARGVGDDLAKAEAATVTVEAWDQGGGVDEIRLYHNGKLVVEDKIVDAPMPEPPPGVGGRVAGAPAPMQAITKSYRVALAPGENVFRAVALNADRTESQPAEAKVEQPGGRATADLYLVAVGLNEYKNPRYNLNFGRADATAIADEIGRRGKGIFRKIDKQLILDSQATRQSIEAALGRVASAAQPGDAFVFYYAGHGVMSEGAQGEQAEFHLAPHDVTQLFGNDEMLAERGVSARLLREWCRRIAAQKQLIVLDACQAGGAVETFAALRGVPEEKAILQLARSVGIIILAATGTEQVAAEFTKLGHGAFTYALLEGLSGKADGGSQPDGKITVKELEAFLNDMVPELTRQYRGTPQFPNSYSRGQDFPLGVK